MADEQVISAGATWGRFSAISAVRALPVPSPLLQQLAALEVGKAIANDLRKKRVVDSCLFPSLDRHR